MKHYNFMCSSRTSHEAGRSQQTKHSSMLEYLRSKKVWCAKPSIPTSAETSGQFPSCGVNHNCEPTGLRGDRVLLFQDGHNVSGFECLITYFFETPYETVIDVGSCSCSKGSPGVLTLPLVETPNKVDLVQTVETCELKERSFRVPYIEFYYKIVYGDDGVKEEKLMEIDVGRCLGGCTAGYRCLLRSPSDSEVCHLWAERPTKSCVPLGYDSHIFLNQHGKISTVFSSSSCLCQS
uniref:Uncharacterized protein n=1 Tax=Oncorhynchus kisutch TaxID=8019 RepID=A0A8C7JEJ7_ONCKI